MSQQVQCSGGPLTDCGVVLQLHPAVAGGGVEWFEEEVEEETEDERWGV